MRKHHSIPANPAALDGRQGIRIFEPCKDPAGASCEIFEDQANLHLVESQWHTFAISIFDGSLISFSPTVASLF